MKKIQWNSTKSTGIAVLFVLLSGCCTGSGEPGSGENSRAASSQSTREFSNLVNNSREENGIPGLAAVIVTSKGIRQKAVSGVRRLGSEESLSLRDRGSAGTFTCHAFLVKELDLAVALMANSATERTSKGLHALRRRLVERYRD